MRTSLNSLGAGDTKKDGMTDFECVLFVKVFILYFLHESEN